MWNRTYRSLGWKLSREGKKIRCNPWNNRQANYRNIFARVNPSWSLSRGPAATCRFHPLPPFPPIHRSISPPGLPRRPPVFNLARALLIRRFFRRPLDPQKPSDANLKATFLKIQRPSRALPPFDSALFQYQFER